MGKSLTPLQRSALGNLQTFSTESIKSGKINMPFKVKILSIDGGGIRGIIPAVILAEIERQTGKQISELFDMVAGTSTGGILALGLTKPSSNNPTQAEYSATQLIELYRKEGERIFQKRNNSWITKVLDVFKYKYSSQGREDVLTKYFGDVLINQAVKEVLVTSYDTKQRIPIFFTSLTEKDRRNRDNFKMVSRKILMRDAAMATSAAPTYFKPYQIDKLSLIDGGTFANNPAALAIVEAMISFRNRGEEISLDDILVVSLGTGSSSEGFEFKTVRKWGELGWAKPFIDMSFDGQSSVVDYQLEQLLHLKKSVASAGSHPHQQQYYRFQCALISNKTSVSINEPMNDASESHIKKLEAKAGYIIETEADKLKALCRQLLE